MMEITPQTRIRDLLQAYPQLEGKLIEIAPVFRKLKNPVLKNTVARVTSIQQAAIIGNIPVERLVNLLRAEAGQGIITGLDDQKYSPCTEEEIKSYHIIQTVDIRPMINSGRQPLNEIMKQVHHLNAGETLKLVAPFIPAPLLDQLEGKHFTSKIRRENDERVEVYITKLEQK